MAQMAYNQKKLLINSQVLNLILLIISLERIVTSYLENHVNKNSLNDITKVKKEIDLLNQKIKKKYVKYKNIINLIF